MQDFFGYSGMAVQAALENTDLRLPPFPAGIRGGPHALADFRSMAA